MQFVLFELDWDFAINIEALTLSPFHPRLADWMAFNLTRAIALHNSSHRPISVVIIKLFRQLCKTYDGRFAVIKAAQQPCSLFSTYDMRSPEGCHNCHYFDNRYKPCFPGETYFLTKGEGQLDVLNLGSSNSFLQKAWLPIKILARST